jgi:hypothetical protein
MTVAEAYQSSSLLFIEKRREGEGKVEGERERESKTEDDRERMRERVGR